jgi:hypothetical protein
VLNILTASIGKLRLLSYTVPIILYVWALVEMADRNKKLIIKDVM